MGGNLSPFRSESRKPAASFLMAPNGPPAFPGPKRLPTGQARERWRCGRPPGPEGAADVTRAGGGASGTACGSSRGRCQLDGGVIDAVPFSFSIFSTKTKHLLGIY